MENDRKHTEIGYKKDFDAWNALQIRIHSDFKGNAFVQGEVWLAYLGVNIGREQDGPPPAFLRPVLIIKRCNQRLCWILPLTRQRPKYLTHHEITRVGEPPSFVVFEHLRSVDSRRLKKKLFQLAAEEVEAIRKRLRDLL